MVEFDVDLAYLADMNQLDDVRLNDENGLFEPIDYVRYERCRMEMDCDGMIEGTWWHCDGCDGTFIYEHGVNPSYCPKCGRERMR